MPHAYHEIAFTDAVKALQERFEVPPELEIVDGGTAGLNLLPFLEGRDRVLQAVPAGLGEGRIGRPAGFAGLGWPGDR